MNEASSAFSAEPLFSALCLAAMAVGSLHSLAPDHWLPFAAVARARDWSAVRTARVTFLCGFGHVTASVLLGLLGLALGVELMKSLGERMEAVAGLLLIGFGLLYALWGLRHRLAARFHGHAHHHYDHVHDPSQVTAWSLFLLFSADPCVAVVPLLFAAAPLGAARTLAIVVVYELATIGTMIALVVPARAGAQLLRFAWLDRWADAAAGVTVAAVGLAVALLGW